MDATRSPLASASSTDGTLPEVDAQSTSSRGTTHRQSTNSSRNNGSFIMNTNRRTFAGSRRTGSSSRSSINSALGLDGSGRLRRTTPSVTRMSSVAGNLRDTIFGRGKADPLEMSGDGEFVLNPIDEAALGSNLPGTSGADVKDDAVDGGDASSATNAWRCSKAGYIVTGIAVFTVLTTLLAAMAFPTFDGYEIDPGLVFGSLQTLLLCTVVFVTYHGVQRFQAHPNPLILYKCIVDMVLALRFLLDPLLLDSHVYKVGDRESCAYLSAFTQMLYFASDSWYFALIVDLYKSLSNPFTSVQGSRRQYTIAVCCMALLSAFITGVVPQFHGFADGNYCWTHRGNSKERNFWKLNVASWMLFYNWMIVVYLAGIAVLVYGRKRLRARTGVHGSLATRLEMLRNSKISIMSYTGYWTCAFFWYAVSFSARTHYEDNGKMSPSKVFRAYAYVLAGRGVVDYFVWFMINHPSLIRAHWLRFSAESADHKFSAQLNTALQQELIFFTIEGMTKAIALADEELTRKRDRSPTLDLVLGVVDEEEKDEEGEGVDSPFTIASDAPVMEEQVEHSSQPTQQQPQTRRPTSSNAQRRVGEGGARRFVSRVLRQSDASSEISSSTSSTTSGAAAHIKFTPYMSESFAELRSACGVEAAAFRESFRTSTKPSISEGASGAFLFFSGDKRFMVKSMAESECRFLCEIAEDYVEYLIRTPSSLMTRFYGCFKITMYDKKFYFVVMENLFDVIEHGVTIHHRYDIKGSWVNRSYKRPRRGAKVKCRHCSMQFKYGAKKALIKCPNVVGRHEPNVVLKDSDLRTRMRIGAEKGRELYEILRNDSLFLCSLGIMDYSLLLGVTDIEFVVDDHDDKDRDASESARMHRVLSAATTVSSSNDAQPSQQHSLSSADRSVSHRSDHSDSSSSTSHSSATYSVRSMAYRSDSTRASHGDNLLHEDDSPPRPPERNSMRKSEKVFGPGFYYIGVIDILQQWNMQKKMERWWKVYMQGKDPDGLSAIDPVRYQARFEAKLREIIVLPKEVQRALRSQSMHTPHTRGRVPSNNTSFVSADSEPISTPRRLFASVAADAAALGALRTHTRLPDPTTASTVPSSHRTALAHDDDDDDDDLDVDLERSTDNSRPILMRADRHAHV